eukprot:TRINITY_DN4335_c1_g1_i1.p1 TRINITY_DN4335_c1_g1~~TRINITY_DN4335_c1_g1_i1.p1  ORF type:complete len:590 (-),score=84.83 TRINITY_DN4335_c1_g1_i1:419-2188(-)
MWGRRACAYRSVRFDVSTRCVLHHFRFSRSARTLSPAGRGAFRFASQLSLRLRFKMSGLDLQGLRRIGIDVAPGPSILLCLPSEQTQEAIVTSTATTAAAIAKAEVTPTSWAELSGGGKGLENNKPFQQKPQQPQQPQPHAEPIVQVAAEPSGSSHVLAAGAPLTSFPAGSGFSLISYNVLLPNSEDGWWIYKYYREPGEFTQWPRRQALLRQQLLSSQASIICLQEVSELSFSTDFGFLVDEGFEAMLHEKKGRMRPATFWRRDMWERVAASHKDRTLTVALRAKDGVSEIKDRPPVFIVNCHLSAGPSADRRLRQVHEALDAVGKECKRLGCNPATLPVVVCGDMNSQGVTAVGELLLTGQVGPDFRESGDPTERGQGGKQITSKNRRHAFMPFREASQEVFGDRQPATLLVANIDSKMLHEDGTMTPEARCKIEAAFEHYLSEGRSLMVRSDVDRWLLDINREIGRGSEYRSALDVFERRGEEVLSKEDFVGIYLHELAEGKFWGVEHDLCAINGPSGGMSQPSDGPCELCFDHIFYTVGPLKLIGVREPLTTEQKERVWGPPWDVLPNAWHPSDHLPVAASFSFA